MKTTLLACLSFLGISGICHADQFMDLQSTYLGKGWFRYRVHTWNDAFFTHADITSFSLPAFTHLEEYAITLDWTNASSTVSNSATWQYTLPVPSQIRPYDRVFLARSSAPAFCHTNKALVTMWLSLSSAYGMNWSGAAGQTVAGYAKVSCISPCATDQADDPSEDMTSSLKLVPDIQARNLILSNQVPYGISYFWDFDSTVLLQGTPDFLHWTNIAYLLGTSGDTTWTTNVPLDGYGTAFRLSLVSSEHVTSPLHSSAIFDPLNLATVGTPAYPVSIRQISQSNVAATISDRSSQFYRFDVLRPDGSVAQIDLWRQLIPPPPPFLTLIHFPKPDSYGRFPYSSDSHTMPCKFDFDARLSSVHFCGMNFVCVLLLLAGLSFLQPASAADSNTVILAETNQSPATNVNSPPYDTVTAAVHTNTAIIPLPRTERNATNRQAQVLLRAKNFPGTYDIEFIGDSITEGWETKGRNVWGEYYGNRTTLNLGVGGDRTQHVLWRIEQGQLDGIRAKVAVVLIGTNNSNGNENTEADILEGIVAIVREIRSHQPDTKILLCAIFPRGKTFGTQRGKILQVNQALAKLNDNATVFFLDIGSQLIEQDGSISTSMMGDFLHPREPGYRIWAQAMEPKLKELLKD